MTIHSRFLVRIAILGFTILFVLLGCFSKKRDFNVIYISLDTTRYDYIDTGKGARAYTPALRRYAERSIVFENAFSTSTQTLPSHMSVFTSRYPHELGVYTNDDKYEHRSKFVSEVFKELGYQTKAIISLGTLNSSTGFQKGFQDFQEDLFEEGVFFVPAEAITSKAIKTVQKLSKDRFFLFLHYSDPHTPYASPEVTGEFSITLDGIPMTRFDSYKGTIIKEQIPIKKGSHVLSFNVDHDMSDFSHFVIRGLIFGEGCSLFTEDLEYSEKLYGGSYKMKNSAARVRIQCEDESFIKIFQIIPILNHKSALEYYRLEVEYMDNSVGRLLRALDDFGLQNNTIVAIFADHGEGLGEKDGFFGHTRYLNRQFIQVPLILRIPGYEQKRIHSPVSLVGLSPTILEILGIREEGFVHEKSFSDAILGRSWDDKIIYSFAYDPPGKKHKLSIIQWPLQCIYYLEDSQVQKKEYYNLYLSQSFSEKDAVHESTIQKGYLSDYLAFQSEFRQLRDIFSLADGQSHRLDKNALERLKALGYMDN